MRRTLVANQISWVMLVLFASVPLFAQSVRDSWEEFADATPFPTDMVAVPSWRFAHGPHVKAAFRDVVAEASQATVRVRADGKKVAYGGIVRSDGWILTKASQLQGEITCRLADGRRFEATIGVTNREYDLALLKIDATDLPILQYAEESIPSVGAWLASVGTGRDPLAVGVMSVEVRKIAHQSGVLGIRLRDRMTPAEVREVYPKTAASKAGVLEGDIILSVNGQPTTSREQLVKTIGEYNPADTVRLEIQRKNEMLTLKATLGGRFPMFRPSREEFQNQLGGDLSQRRFGFPAAFQHDTVVKPTDCGSPLVNLDGKVVGINIARAGRTETYAIDQETILGLVDEMLTDNPLVEQVEQVSTESPSAD